MFSTPILDVAIALFFAYFLLAIIVSAVNEVIMSLLNMRGKMLKQTILNMIDDPKWHELSKEIINSPIINSLREKDGSFPSYISPQAFVEAFKYAGDVRGIFSVSNEIHFKEVDEKNAVIKMLKVFADSSANVFAFERKIENLFNGSMDRVRGWYKRKVQNIIFVISLVMVTTLNVDTINLVDVLWKNPVMAEVTANRISNLIEKNESSGNLSSLSDTTTSKTKRIKVAYDILNEMPFPVGWRQNEISSLPNDFGGWITKIFGILLTSFAVTLGAPFWFDILNKIVNLRSTGNKPDKKDGN